MAAGSATRLQCVSGVVPCHSCRSCVRAFVLRSCALKGKINLFLSNTTATTGAQQCKESIVCTASYLRQLQGDKPFLHCTVDWSCKICVFLWTFTYKVDKFVDFIEKISCKCVITFLYIFIYIYTHLSFNLKRNNIFRLKCTNWMLFIQIYFITQFFYFNFF